MQLRNATVPTACSRGESGASQGQGTEKAPRTLGKLGLQKNRLE